MGQGSRPRRRVEKRSAAPNYDRTMDAPGVMGNQSSKSADEARSVDFDGESEPDVNGDAGDQTNQEHKSKDSYLNEQPPHY